MAVLVQRHRWVVLLLVSLDLITLLLPAAEERAGIALRRP